MQTLSVFGDFGPALVVNPEDLSSAMTFIQDLGLHQFLGDAFAGADESVNGPLPFVEQFFKLPYDHRSGGVS